MFNSVNHPFILILYILLFLLFRRRHFANIKLKILLEIIKKIVSSTSFTGILPLFCDPGVYKWFEPYSTVNHIDSLLQNSTSQILIQNSTSQTLPSMELAVHFLLFLVRIACQDKSKWSEWIFEWNPQSCSHKLLHFWCCLYLQRIQAVILILRWKIYYHIAHESWNSHAVRTWKLNYMFLYETQKQYCSYPMTVSLILIIRWVED